MFNFLKNPLKGFSLARKKEAKKEYPRILTFYIRKKYKILRPFISIISSYTYLYIILYILYIIKKEIYKERNITFTSILPDLSPKAYSSVA